MKNMARRVYWFTWWFKDKGASQGQPITYCNTFSLRRAYSLFCSDLRTYRVELNRLESRPLTIRDVYWILEEAYYDPRGRLHHLTSEQTNQRLVEIGVQPDAPPWLKDDIILATKGGGVS